MDLFSRQHDSPAIIETIQDFYNKSLEYYDELFPIDQNAFLFFSDLRASLDLDPQTSTIKPLCRYLGIGSATGNLEIKLSNMQFDVTAIDRNPKMVSTAQRRLKRDISTARFFEMSALEMRRFLKEASLNIIGCLDNTLPYISDETLLRKFFYDSKSLLAPQGYLVLELLNFDAIPEGSVFNLPERSSLRVSLTRTLTHTPEGLMELNAELELGSGKILSLAPGTHINPIKRTQIELWGKEAGFTQFEFYSDYLKAPWTKDKETTIAVLH